MSSMSVDYDKALKDAEEEETNDFIATHILAMQDIIMAMLDSHTTVEGEDLTFPKVINWAYEDIPLRFTLVITEPVENESIIYQPLMNDLKYH